MRRDADLRAKRGHRRGSCRQIPSVIPVHGELQIKLKFKGLEGLVGLRMRHLVILLVHLITAVLRLVRPGGVRAVVAESVLAKHQLLIFDRSRRRAPNLTLWIG